jgi:hypothetical protein
MTNMYPVVVIRRLKNGQTWPTSDTMAICTTQERAEEIILGNENDIMETDAEYAVVEELPMDYTYPVGERDLQWWYKWEGTYEDGKFVKCEKPKQFENIVGWL